MGARADDSCGLYALSCGETTDDLPERGRALALFKEIRPLAAFARAMLNNLICALAHKTHENAGEGHSKRGEPDRAEPFRPRILPQLQGQPCEQKRQETDDYACIGNAVRGTEGFLQLLVFHIGVVLSFLQILTFLSSSALHRIYTELHRESALVECLVLRNIEERTQNRPDPCGSREAASLDCG